MISTTSDIDLDLCLGSPHLFEESSLSTMWSEGQAPQIPTQPSTVSSPSAHFPRSRNGLKSISWKVKDIVERQGSTSYKSVADELLSELNIPTTATKDEKNIRRRVYDALNVLIAADVLCKNGRFVEIKHKNKENFSCDSESVIEKRKILQELVEKVGSMKGLINRNMKKSKPQAILKVPFVVLLTDSPIERDLKLEMKVSSRGIDANVKFDKPFEVLTSYEVITKLCLHNHYADLPTEVLRICKGTSEGKF
ncbi:unnamed protein product [Blepharisma stoltei]|uniref:E2F/DP family winged-helix DNA-binding domain-containing protein n=1 Tax=Blepharisma stoltei TaxID=1481888 RepID=A0AAU9J220_9CILI|nr:unnamed protein product [Blepharisma stoltei]